MIRRLSLALLLLAFGWVCESSGAQPSGSPKPKGGPATTEKPAKSSSAKAAPKAAEKREESKDDSKEGGDDDPLAKIFGEGGFNMSALSEDSQLTMESDPATGDLRYLKVKKNVKIESETINLQCDDLVVDMAEGKRELVAVGGPVVFSNKDVSGECSRLVYNLDSKKMVLTGAGSRPWITQKKGSTVTKTSANIITVTQSESGSSVSLEGKPVISSMSPGKEKKEEKSGDEKKAGEKVNGNDDKSVGNIPRAPVTQK